MVAAYTYDSFAVYNPIADQVVENATAGKFVAVKDGPALPIYDMNGTVISAITSNGSGQTIRFRADALNGLVQFGDLACPVWANEVGALAASAAAALTAANAAVATANQAMQAVTDLIAGGGGGGGGVSDHGALSGLTDDDHPQYHTDTRGDARYYLKAAVDAAVAAAATQTSAADRDRRNHTFTQTASSISDFATAVNLAVVPRIYRRTAVQGVPTATECAAAGYPDDSLIVVDP